MSDLPELPSELPPGFRHVQIAGDEMDYLMHFWELRNHGKVFEWAVKLLHDLTKADEMGWRMTLHKAEVDETTRAITFNPDYTHALFLLKWLAPTDGAYVRIPVDRLEKLRIPQPEGQPQP